MKYEIHILIEMKKKLSLKSKYRICSILALLCEKTAMRRAETNSITSPHGPYVSKNRVFNIFLILQPFHISVMQLTGAILRADKLVLDSTKSILAWFVFLILNQIFVPVYDIFFYSKTRDEFYRIMNDL